MEKIKKLKKIFEREEIDGYIIPKNDKFFFEYVPKYNDRLNFISSFNGSYGFALILKEKNYLFVDGRYTLQANNQSGDVFKVITIPRKMPKDILKNKKISIGLDPKLFTKKTLDIFFNKTQCNFKLIKDNLIDKIWKRNKKKSVKKFYSIPDSFVGENYEKKINRIIVNLKNKGADYQFISACENNAWLLNIRGEDSRYSPIPYSYILVSKNKNIQLFCNLKKVSLSLRRKLNKINFLDIKLVNKYLASINKKKFIIDKNTCSIHFENLISKYNKILKFNDPIYKFKAIKSKQEIESIKKTHIYDGVALTKYLFWVKNNFFKKTITEISASQKLLQFRKKNKKFKFLSFPTISGSGPNGSIIHYNATNKTNRVLRKGDIYLVDSGGQYEFGTTDVTRTISLNNHNKRIKNIFTRVLKGHIAVNRFNLKRNTAGYSIDRVARKYLNQINLDYAHGTGHGVGFFSNVHEGPQAISKNNKVLIEEGMVISNEPGYYENSKFGIRIENLIYVKKYKKKLMFENLTLAPIDKNLIELSILKKYEKFWINMYHKKVFNSLKSYMNFSELRDLKKACSAIV